MTCLVLIAGLASGCGNISGKIRSLSNSHTIDFARSEIIVSGSSIADGQSELLLVIKLVNSDKSPILGYKPAYDVISGLGVTASECTTSDTNGVSTCILKSTQSGTKRVSVSNIKISLQKDVLFVSPPLGGKNLAGFVPASEKQTSGQYTVSATIGGLEDSHVKINGEYKLYGGFQGDAFSR